MSWSIFKQNILAVANSPEGIASIDQIASLYTSEYDSAIKRGGDTINKIPLLKGNTDLMKEMFILAFQQGLQSTQPYDLVGNMGKGVIAYWEGAELNKSPIPILPAVGSTINISIASAICSTAGQWETALGLPPTNSTSIIIDEFINYATIHLGTIGGTITTVSLYPPVGTPGPGIVKWQGYTVPPAQPGGGAPIQEQFQMNEQDIAVKEEEKAQAEEIKTNPNATIEQQNSADEYSALVTQEIQTKEFNSIPDQTTTPEQVDSIAEVTNSDPSFECPVGLKVVAAAKRDIGIIETGTTANNGAGKNYGGRLNPNGELPNAGVPGRIDTMVGLAGLDNQAQVRATGEGYYWCASAVTAWWKAAGLPTPPGAASCRSWASWAKSKGLYSKVPTVGAAVLYGPEDKEHHIGIVASVNGGKVTTIEGNTGGGGFNRNGCGCFLKNPNIKNISGYVIPPGCNK